MTLRADHHTSTEADAAEFERRRAPLDADRPDVHPEDVPTGHWQPGQDRALVDAVAAAQREAGLA